MAGQNDGGATDLIAEIEKQNAMREKISLPNNLEFWPGLMTLFSLSFGPTFIALTISEVQSVNSRQMT